MREIKFRAYIKDLTGLNEHHFNRPQIGRMFEVETIDFANECIVCRTPSETYLDFAQIELLQYTGLKDKNGKKIYEGDIMKTFNGNGVVQYDAPGFKTSNEYQEVFSTCHESWEVIGNLWENPELLKE